MRLFEMEHLPASAGGVKIVWTDRNAGRTRDTIYLPRGDTADFWPLLGGKQFLYQVFHRPENVRLLEEGDSFGRTPRFMYDTSVYFGGIDAAPFLVKLEDVIIHQMKRERGSLEEQLFRLLKPEEVLKYEAATSRVASRQGDWFAVPFCAHKDDIALRHVCNAHKLKLVAVPELGDSLYSTPHKMYDGWMTRGDWGRDMPPLIGQGVLKKNGHPDLVLATPHLLLRADWIERTFPAQEVLPH